MEDVPVLAPLEALRYFRDKGFTFGFSWQDVWQEEHARAFTVAKAMSRDVLETIRAAVDQAIDEGRTLDQFRRELQPELERVGWWGRKRMIDPLTAEAKTVQLGSPRRLKTIFAVNMRTSYQAGRWERIDRQKKAFPFLRYSSVMDGRERPEHGAWNGTVKPVDDPWWDSHYPPCGWNCRCTATAFNQRMLDKRGYAVTDAPAEFPMRDWTNKRTGEVHQVEEGIDPGWSYNVGKAALAGQAPPPAPDGFDGIDIAAATDLAAPIAAFFAPFGIEAGEAQRGRVITDAGGWPLAMSLAWFQADGRLVLPAPARRRHLGAAGAALALPEEVRWVWVTGRDGSAMLVRRYIGADAIVDVGRSLWRFVPIGALADPRSMRRGVLAWSSDRPATAASSGHQPRDRLGRWAGRGSAGHAAAAMWDGGEQSRHDLPKVSLDEGARIVRETGVKVTGFARAFQTHEVQHVRNAHGDDVVERARGQRAVRPGDFDLIPRIASEGKSTIIGSPSSRKPLRLVHRLKIGRETYDYRETIAPAKRQLLLQSLRVEVDQD